ncbi:MAG: hypothetical protein FVQ85_19120 [Planctomycetes bacterium]|nr:hypothetical protein [Planctomycetota bacterium]
MKLKRVLSVSVCTAILILFASLTSAKNIDPDNDGSQYAYGENVGWLNFEPSEGPGITVNDANLTGFVWAENIGWINLDPNDANPNTGIANDGTGLLTGLAWGENVGWINFDPNVPGDSNYYGVTIDHDGNFNGWAWGENIGWIHFRSTTPVAYKVQTQWITTCEVDFDDLRRFVQDWLESGGEFPGDLDSNGSVNFLDYTVITDLWLQLCPAGWPLK